MAKRLSVEIGMCQVVAVLAVVVLLGGCERKGATGADGGKADASGPRDGDADGSARPRVAYVTNGSAQFWVIAKAGAEAGGAAFDASVTVHMPAGIAEQKRVMEDLLTRGVDGIAVSPIDPANQTDLINRAATRTNVITHDSDAPESERLCYVGMDNYRAGRMCGALVREALPRGGKVMIFIGRLEQDNARRRRQGVIDELLDRPHDPSNYDPPGSDPLTGGGFTILGTMTDQFDRAKGKANAEDAIARHPDLDGMIGLFEYNPPLCLEALTQAGKLGQIAVIGFDEADETLQGIVDGTVHGTVAQNPWEYGHRSVEVLAALARGDRSVLPSSGFIDIPARAIRADNVEAFRADLNAKMGR